MLLFLTVPWVGLHHVIVVFPDHTHLLFGARLSKLSGSAREISCAGANGENTKYRSLRVCESIVLPSKTLIYSPLR